MTAERTRKILIFTSALYGLVAIPAALQVPPVVRFLISQAPESRDLLIDAVLSAIALFPVSIALSIALSWIFYKKHRLLLALLATLLPILNILVVWGGNTYAQYSLSHWLE